jgi:hypothetical protein
VHCSSEGCSVALPRRLVFSLCSSDLPSQDCSRVQCSSKGAAQLARVQSSSQGYRGAQQDSVEHSRVQPSSEGAGWLRRVEHSSQRCSAALLSRCGVDQRVHSSSEGCSVAQQGSVEHSRVQPSSEGAR